LTYGTPSPSHLGVSNGQAAAAGVAGTAAVAISSLLRQLRPLLYLITATITTIISMEEEKLRCWTPLIWHGEMSERGGSRTGRLEIHVCFYLIYHFLQSTVLAIIQHTFLKYVSFSSTSNCKQNSFFF